MRTPGSAAELEARRRRAAEHFQAGKSLRATARLRGVHLSSVKRWKRAWRQGGEDALSAKPHPGGACKLTGRQLDELVVAGPREAGFPTDLWTCARVAGVVRERFGVEYHPSHVAKLLHTLGFSPQKPRQAAREQDPEAVERWRRVDWPRIKKKPAGVAPALFFSTKPASCCNR